MPKSPARPARPLKPSRTTMPVPLSPPPRAKSTAGATPMPAPTVPRDPVHGPTTRRLAPPALPALAQRYEGTKDGVPVHYIVAGVGRDTDPLVAFYIPGRARGTATSVVATTTITTIRWSLFVRDYAPRLCPMRDSVVQKLNATREERRHIGARTGKAAVSSPKTKTGKAPSAKAKRARAATSRSSRPARASR